MPDQRQRQQRDDRCALSAGEPFDQLCDNFLPSWPGLGIVFQKLRRARFALLMGDARSRLWRLGVGNGSQMVPQPIEIAQNGLGVWEAAARAAQAAK
jgi:hypothetical protein